MVNEELTRCQNWIDAALAYSGGTHDFIDIADGVHRGVMQLWPTPRGCVVTEIVNYPRRKVLNLFLIGGELDQILDMHDDMIAWAKAQGCDAMTGTGRVGWGKPLAKYGWKKQSATFVKEI